VVTVVWRVSVLLYIAEGHLIKRQIAIFKVANVFM
jgi:hypothetical protein